MTVPSWASVHSDVPKIPKQAEGPVGCTYAVPATAQLHNSAPSPESEEHRRSDASVEARHIMEAIKRSLDPKHNARPIHPTVHFAQKGSIATQNGASVSAPTPVVSIVPTPARPVTTASELARARPSARSPSPSLPKPPMEAIEAIEQDTAPTRSLAYTANNMPLRIFEHALTSLLTRLDAIESAGSTEVRDARKDLVQRIEGVLNELESKKLGVWQQQNKDEDASAKVYEPHSEDDPADEESKDDTPTDDISSSPEAVDAEVGEVSVVPVLAP
ncbi:uncharacterized protein EI90DRAFT_258265 [Cantharellus anzutake]|uniref:uncharacterized protein n=1 Tax=Cantharellus anzutake TaxID=1750568 RepID=UPI00190574AF|nr:uncharacterized protein EI90DRAFT_258265 [Cantharellus anzutake]KAF8335790.1 hypothetical protein EI90DRAFT_258265 [Cantharellus anzutake]